MENLTTKAFGAGIAAGGNLATGCSSYSAMNHNECRNSFGSLGTRRLVQVNDPYDKFSMRDREAMAHTWHFQLISSECFLADLMYKYVRELEQMMTEKGMMKFNLKRSVNELKQQVESLQKLVNGHGKAQVMVFCKPMFAPMADEYYNDGGDLTSRIVLRIKNRLDSDMQRCSTAQRTC